jgi:predicted dithiol-disulfide oxidoreductase (DUF899 family)
MGQPTISEAEMDDPQVVSPGEWLAARRRLLVKEKELSRQRDALNAERRRLPMTEISKRYMFEGRHGQASLPGLFEGRSQLLIHHFMFDPDWEEGCKSCSLVADNVGHQAHLHARDTTLAMVSRAPLARIEPFRQRMGWDLPWYSSSGSDFNYDFHATLDQAIAPVEYNYRNLAELGPEWQGWSGEMHGISAFLRRGDRVFHTYSSYARGTDLMASTYNWLDLTARGRQEDWEQPPGRSDSPLMGWLRHHDKYGA